MKPRLLIIGFVILTILGTSFLLWRSSPEQTVKRQAHRLLNCLEKGALSRTTPSEKADLLVDLLTRSFKVQAPYPVDSGSFNHAQAAQSLRDFHNSVMSCAISRDNPLINLESDTSGRYEVILSVEITLGPRRQHHLKYKCLIEFIRDEEEWLARAIILNPI